MRDVIDAVPDIIGDVIEVSFDGISQLPVLRMPGCARVDLDDAAAERFGRAWNEALLRRERAKAAQP